LCASVVNPQEIVTLTVYGPICPAEEYSHQISDLLNSQLFQPDTDLLESLSLLKEVDKGLSLAETTAGLLVQHILLDSLSETHFNRARHYDEVVHAASDHSDTDLQGLHLQVALIWLNGWYNLSKELPTPHSPNDDLETAIRQLEAFLVYTGDFVVAPIFLFLRDEKVSWVAVLDPNLPTHLT
jgi:hypothetical protein